ncbi:hypothetical protein F5884DRAFT_748400 [Xylogone sp. PMI_703]|nr:hypothetical protein F5884DRAFT_748400 [Xylogone sp. PMI_703]
MYPPHGLSILAVLSQAVAAISAVDVRDPSSSPGTSSCVSACHGLDSALPGKVAFPNSTVYDFEESRYWSVQQASTTPACRLSPTSAQDVSTAIQLLKKYECQFSVKSGGHAAFTGGSNINGGVTIDLVNMNEVSVNAARNVTSLGPGNRWFDVYSKLEPMGLSVVGGRVADIGVGGLTLGGGISFFSGQFGWACDNVVNYEVVLADGSIKDVNEQSYPDLYFALRGGGNNFGIVTRFDLFTFPQGEMWGGSLTFLSDASAALINAFTDFNINAPEDTHAAVILAYAFVQSEGLWIEALDLEYAKPVANPPIFQNFTSIPNSVASTLAISNLTDLTLAFNASNPGGFRQTYWTVMTKNSGQLLNQSVNIFMEEIAPVANASGILPSIVLQPITTDMTSHFTQNGGNALGITAADGPLTLINLAISWSSITDDDAIMAAARNTINRINSTAYAMDLGNPFIYQNYAALEQKVFPGYGAKNYKKLQQISKKYDPHGVFQTLQPGYFKLNE